MSNQSNHKYDISAFYFPNFHHDPQNEAWHGKGWNEWDVLKAAKPRFEGHSLPNMPLWGYEDESIPAVMSKKIDAAANHGVTNLLFDWYWYANGPFLNAALDTGFLGADNHHRVNFSLMWANHHWQDIHPAAHNPAGRRTLLTWDLSEAAFFEAVFYVAKNYFSRPTYYKIDGKLFFSIYEIGTFVKNFGGAENAARILTKMRKVVSDCGLGEMHLNCMVRGMRILASETAVDDGTIKKLGIDSITS